MFALVEFILKANPLGVGLLITLKHDLCQYTNHPLNCTFKIHHTHAKKHGF
ncbi:hypothetical protein N402_08700 [Helicobacter pylori FD423]|nr:hypothetical protein N402_08700 [Helicobacter pylori FD423]